MLSVAGMCEISRNSVVHFGFENKIKRHWIGKKWYLSGVKGNDVEKTNVPNTRVAFHHETLREGLELDMLQRYPPALRMLSVVTGNSEMAERAATKKRERLRLAAEQQVDEDGELDSKA
ncbi:AMP deaminase [Mortierella sp. AD032]|nr:AMP deaminase [Mortierella sp. AD032]